jgi:hypothetical protein
MRIKLAVALVVHFLACVARADGMPAGTLYDINGSMTLTGNSACPSCVETINYSFVLDVSSDCPISIPECVIGAVTSSQSGPLGTFVSEDRLLPDHGIYLAFDAPGLDQLDMYIGMENGVPIALPSNLFECGSAACVDFSVGDGYEFAVANEFTAVDPLSRTPEPSSLLLLAAGLVALAGITASRSGGSRRSNA